MKQLLTRNLGWKLLSLVIAFLLWVAVARQPELATVQQVPVQFKNVPDDIDFGTGVPDRVDLEVRGMADRLTREHLSDVAVVFDLSDAHPGQRTYTIREANASLPYGLSFYRAIPSQVTLRIQQLVTREIAVKAVFVNIPDGYRLESDVETPSRIRVRGPDERLKNVTQAMTDPLDLTGVVSTKEFHTNVNVGDPRVRLETPTAVSVKVTLVKIDAKRPG